MPTPTHDEQHLDDNSDRDARESLVPEERHGSGNPAAALTNRSMTTHRSGHRFDAACELGSPMSIVTPARRSRSASTWPDPVAGVKHASSPQSSW
jgi:hypothetical protein